MKRSEINKILTDAYAFIEAKGFRLPVWALTPAAEWAVRGAEYDEIRDLGLGWDVTDYGHGKFAEIGLTLFTIRNGSASDPRYPKPYAEKLLITRENQVCPCHFHQRKREDIINRGGGILCMRLWQSSEDGGLSADNFEVNSDGVNMTMRPGDILRLAPGESVTLTPGLYHSFWAEAGGGTVLAGEVSSVNDDLSDNHFYTEQARFPVIEEDESPLWLLCSEYKSAK
ncbi:MAG: D-lyxose/D-mannose family sugar isomerase [Oscillospiraceae bacterium]|jgi:D-lyxose ketol-isomerase|nr:D-lyxose/D-mannose family sugar isomerase [Oscillospiraceae bacterium]